MSDNEDIMETETVTENTVQPVETVAQPMNLQEITKSAKAETVVQPGSLERIFDINVIMSVELGGSKICVRDLLQLNHGSVVALDRLAGEPLDVLVNGTLVARGEVVVIDRKFGVRLTHVISPEERIEKLR